jgi:hypothetical protein
MSPIVAVAAMLAALAASGVAIVLTRGLRARPPGGEEPPVAGSAASSAAETRPRLAFPRPRSGLGPPKLLVSGLDQPERRPGGATIEDLSQHQRDALEELERTARERAAASVGLTAEEVVELDDVHRQADRRRAELEAQVDRATGTYLPGALVGLHRSEMTALRDLSRSLTPARARALRLAEADAYDRAWEDLARDEQAPLALKHVAHRRTMFLRSGTAQPEGLPPELAPPAAGEDTPD